MFMYIQLEHAQRLERLVPRTFANPAGSQATQASQFPLGNRRETTSIPWRKSKCSYIAGHTDTSKPAASLSLLSPAKAVKSSNLITGEIRKIQALMMVNYNHDDVEMALAPT